MGNVFYSLGEHPIAGAIVALLAAAIIIVSEYIRLKKQDRWLIYLPFVQAVGVVAVILSVLLMASRFVAVLSPR